MSLKWTLVHPVLLAALLVLAGAVVLGFKSTDELVDIIIHQKFL